MFIPWPWNPDFWLQFPLEETAMPDDQRTASESGQLFQLATSIPPPHPFFRLPFRARDLVTGRDEQHERRCPVCDLVKITVIPKQGEAFRAYRFGEDGKQFSANRDPRCQGFKTLEFGEGSRTA